MLLHTVNPFNFATQYTILLKLTTVFQAVLLDGHLLCQLRQRLVDGVAAS